MSTEAASKAEPEATETTTEVKNVEEAKAAVKAPLKRVPRPTRPDRSELDKQIATLRDQRNKCHDKMNELKGKIDAIKEGRRGQGSATQEPRNKLIALRTELKGLYVSSSLCRVESSDFPEKKKEENQRGTY